MRMHDPPHPGEIIREFCIEPLNLTVTEAAVWKRGHTYFFCFLCLTPIRVMTTLPRDFASFFKNESLPQA